MSALLQVVLHHILEEYFFSNIHHTMDQELNPSSSMTGQLGFVPNLQTEELARTPLFQKLTAGLPEDEQVDLAYARCRAIMKAYNLTATDISTLSPRYWQFHSDPVLMMDGGVITLLTIHTNLCIGTLAKFSHRSDVSRLIEQLLRFELSGQYCLTELGHGLDAFHLETRVELQPDGTFILNTPSPRSNKFMPPNAPSGIPIVAVVFARLFVLSQDHGIKPFIVHMHDGFTMTNGITTRLLTPRGGSGAVKHSVTQFQNVHLPATALLGHTTRAVDQKAAFFGNISRVVTGTLCMGTFSLSALRISANVAAKYSMRRVVTDATTGSMVPIFSFITQSLPVMTAIAQAQVLSAYANATHAIFTNEKTPHDVRHLVAAVFKVTTTRMASATLRILEDRCGAQGLFGVNQIFANHCDLRGSAIAEGDIQVISIKFAMELLLGRIALPSTRPAFTGVVAQHEQGVLAEMRSVLASNKASHRSVSLASVILPRCIAIIEAIGHRMALEAATAAGTDPALIDIFTTNVISSDSAWYVEHGLTRAEQARMEREAVYAATPRLQEFVDGLRSDAFITAPIASDERWDAYMSSLPTFTSESLDTLPSIALKSMSPAAILEIPEIPLMPRL